MRLTDQRQLNNINLQASVETESSKKNQEQRAVIARVRRVYIKDTIRKDRIAEERTYEVNRGETMLRPREAGWQ